MALARVGLLATKRKKTGRGQQCAVLSRGYHGHTCKSRSFVSRGDT